MVEDLSPKVWVSYSPMRGRPKLREAMDEKKSAWTLHHEVLYRDPTPNPQSLYSYQLRIPTLNPKPLNTENPKNPKPLNPKPLQTPNPHPFHIVCSPQGSKYPVTIYSPKS